MENRPVPQCTERLLCDAGVGTEIRKITPLPGGMNNRVYRVDTASGTVTLKSYYQVGDWDRQAAESHFLRFCERTGIARVPRLLAEDRESGLALHSWIDGKRLDAEKLNADAVDEAAFFLGDLARESCKATDILPARDACLCLEDYFRSPQLRLAALERSLTENAKVLFFKEALGFFKDKLWPAWERARDVVLLRLGKRDLHRPLQCSALVVSPSDFGFHNALRKACGHLGFVDFEYAGLDSPVKAIGDFLHQPDFPTPPGTLAKLAASVRSWQGHDLAAEVSLLAPLFRIKFCCIILNDFKQDDSARRIYAAGNVMREQQLEKARKYLLNERAT